MQVLGILAVLSGGTLVAGAGCSAAETFALPRGAPDALNRLVFSSIHDG